MQNEPRIPATRSRVVAGACNGLAPPASHSPADRQTDSSSSAGWPWSGVQGSTAGTSSMAPLLMGPAMLLNNTRRGRHGLLSSTFQKPVLDVLLTRCVGYTRQDVLRSRWWAVTDLQCSRALLSASVDPLFTLVLSRAVVCSSVHAGFNRINHVSFLLACQLFLQQICQVLTEFCIPQRNRHFSHFSSGFLY